MTLIPQSVGGGVSLKTAAGWEEAFCTELTLRLGRAVGVFLAPFFSLGAAETILVVE